MFKRVDYLLLLVAFMCGVMARVTFVVWIFIAPLL